MSGGRIFRLWPRSAFGQTGILIAGALLLAQAVGFFLLISAQEQAQLLRQYGPTVDQFAILAATVQRAPAAERASILATMPVDGSQVKIAAESEISRRRLNRDKNLEQQTIEALEAAGLPDDVVVEGSSMGFDDAINERGPPSNGGFPDGRPPPDEQMGPPPDAPPGPPVPGGPPSDRPLPHRPGQPPGKPQDSLAITLAMRLGDGTWLNSEMRAARLSPNLYWRIAMAEAILCIIVLAAAIYIAGRLTRPLRSLAGAAEALGASAAPQPIALNGPQEVQAAVASFNRMSDRVNALLADKDRMLGALGHDLRTPLASLRIRLESMEPETERERAIATIREMAQTVEDILDLARAGRSSEAFYPVDLAALTDSVVEDFRSLGHDVNFEDAERIVLRLQPSLMKRLLRNLLENAVKFGERARVRIAVEADQVRLSVEDDGPGIPADMIDKVIAPFLRLEVSRSRETGGIGLGLSIADAIARSQGGRLTFENLPAKGLRVGVIFSATLARIDST